jgi:hypothetical protein
MVSIKLIPDKPIWVQVSNDNCLVTRIGEIVLLPNEANTIDEIFSSRPPWESLLVADHFSINSGSYINYNASNKETVLNLISQKWDIDKIVALQDKEFTVSLLQQNDNNGYQAAINNGCKLVGSRIDSDKICLDFSIDRSEMIYNR